MSDAKGREVELKLRVDDLAALMKIAIASGGTPQPTAHQRNAFYDTPDRALAQRGLVVRVRTERARDDVKTFVTAKGPGTRQGHVSTVLEEEVEIDAATAAAIVAGKHDPIASLSAPSLSQVSDTRRALLGAIASAIGNNALVAVGAFHNERTRIPVELVDPETLTRLRAVLELDRTTFPGDQVHHEVEMEIPTDVDAAVAERAYDALFKRANVAGRTAPGKARRFFAALDGATLD